MSTEISPVVPALPVKPPPPLQNGDRLTRDEFERRYHAMPHVNKAELIEGVVYVPSPVRLGHHGHPHFRLILWLGIYEGSTPGLIGADNTTTRLDVINEPQPDVALMIHPDCGGQARISADDYIEHAPELVAEVSSSTVSIDMNAKRQVYERTGVREYLVWRLYDEALDWFILRGDEYEPLQAGADGVHRSEVFPGLWLDVPALLRGDGLRLMDVLRQGLATPEHAAFVAHLQARRT